MTMANENAAILTERIGEMNLIALRKYACPKISSQKDWYLKCVECSGRDGCPAGKRAVELIESETAPTGFKSQIEKFEERLQKTAKMGHMTKHSDKFIEAIKQDDPSQWLVDHGYYDRKWRANDALKQWKIRNGYQVKSDKKPTDSLAPYRERRVQKTRDKITKLLDGCSDEKTLLTRLQTDTPKCLTSAITARLYDWIKKYPDLVEGHPEMQGLLKTLRRITRKEALTRGQTVNTGISLEEAMDILYGEKRSTKEDENEEFDVNDLLSEYPVEEDDTPEEKLEPEPQSDIQEAVIDTAKSVDLNRMIDYATSSLLKEELIGKCRGFEDELAETKAEIDKLNIRMVILRQKIETLHDTMTIFGIDKEEYTNE